METIENLIWEFENGSISAYKLIEKLKTINDNIKQLNKQKLWKNIAIVVEQDHYGQILHCVVTVMNTQSFTQRQKIKIRVTPN